MIYKKILEIAKKNLALKKDGENPHYKSHYFTLDSIIETYGPLLSELQVIIYHSLKDKILTTSLHDTEDDSSITSEFEIFNSDPQKRGAEITYGKRYNLGMLLNIMTDTDDDGNKASGENFSQEPELPWIAPVNIANLQKLISEGIIFTMKDIRLKYKVSKKSVEELNNLGIK